MEDEDDEINGIPDEQGDGWDYFSEEEFERDYDEKEDWWAS